MTMSPVEFIRMVAANGTRQPFFEAIRLNEAADRLEQLENEVLDLRRAVATVAQFLDQNGSWLGPILDDQEDHSLTDLMLRQLRATIAPATPLRTTAVTGDQITIRSAEDPASILARETSPIERVVDMERVVREKLERNDTMLHEEIAFALARSADPPDEAPRGAEYPTVILDEVAALSDKDIDLINARLRRTFRWHTAPTETTESDPPNPAEGDEQ